MSILSDKIIAKGVELYLQHGEASGTAAVDSSGNSRNGVYSGSPELGINGLLANGDATNKAFRTTTGASKYCQVASAAWMNGWTQMTVMTVVELESANDIDNGDALVTRYSSAGFQWLVWRTPANKLGFQVITSAGTFNATSTLTPTLDVPYIIFGVWTGTRLKIYHSRIDTPSLVLGADIAISGTIATSSAPIEIGRYSSSANTTPTAIFDETVVDNAAWDEAFMQEILEAATTIPPPGTPTGLSSSPELTTATISWTASTGEVTKYEVRLNGGAVVDSGSDLEHIFTGLTPETQYTAEVRAVGPGGNSGWASTVFTTDVAPPGTPTDLSSSTESNAATISWVASTGTVTNYEVRLNGGSIVDSGADLEHTFGGLNPETGYTAEVRAVGPGGSSGWASIIFTTDVAVYPSARVEWHKPGERIFEAGVDQVVLYPRLGSGVAWNGVVAVSENTSGGDLESLYFDGVKYRDLIAAEVFSATLEAFMAPAEFDAADGRKMLSPGLIATQQPRKSFGLCYRTLVGNDLVGTDYGYKLHIVYNCTASPAPRSHQTIAGAITAPTRSWQLNTVPPPANTFRPTAHLVVDSTLVDPYLMADLETILYGRDASEGQAAMSPYLPTVAEIIAILSNPISEFIEDFI